MKINDTFHVDNCTILAFQDESLTEDFSCSEVLIDGEKYKVANAQAVSSISGNLVGFIRLEKTPEITVGEFEIVK